MFDPMYFLFILPGLALSLWASFKTRSAFNKYSRVRAATGLTGAQAALRMLQSAGIEDVEIVRTHGGGLSDHYNPVTKKLALSQAVHDQPSVAAIGVACHEAGHAIQHAEKYAPLWLRSVLVPTANIGSSLGYIVMIAGLFMGMMKVFVVGAVMFSMVLLFQVVTLPVEFDASARAKKLAFANGIVLDSERQGMAKVLNAAALTYVAAAVSTLMTLLYFLMRAGLLGGRRD
jgi:Zn-dependent membrane protease YugP